MARTTVPVFSGTLQPGPGKIIPVTAVPAGATTLQLEVDRTQWLDPAVKVRCSLEISCDGGEFKEFAGFTAQGRPLQAPTPRNPNPNVIRGPISLDYPSIANRKLRGQVVVTGGAFTTSVAVDFS